MKNPKAKFKVGQVVMRVGSKNDFAPFKILEAEYCHGTWYYSFNETDSVSESSVRRLTREESGSEEPTK